jgi:hypothetical protein
MKNALYNLYRWTHKGYQIYLKIVIGRFSRELNTILKPELKKMADPINVKVYVFVQRS